MNRIYNKIRNFLENWRVHLLRLITAFTIYLSVYSFTNQMIVLGILNSLVSLFLLLIVIVTSGIRQYKTYFDKSDTPFRQDFQPKNKYHIVWKRMAYLCFLKHKVIKIKWFGIFTIYNIKKGEIK